MFFLLAFFSFVGWICGSLFWGFIVGLIVGFIYWVISHPGRRNKASDFVVSAFDDIPSVFDSD